MNTIFALSTHPGKSGVAIIRLSGEYSHRALQYLIKDNVSLLKPRVMYLKTLYYPGTEEIIDHAMIVKFNCPASFTGEDMVELHLHGSIAIINIIYSELLKLPNLKVAEPGEFSQRAFLNNKMDLTAAEGLADLINAETKMQAKQAIRQASGGLNKLYDEWYNQLLSIISLIEAFIDFPDEEIPNEILAQVEQKVEFLKESLTTHLNDKNRGERLRNGIKLAILGAPNAGKSSLLNFLLNREVAIVSSIPGTTRDIIEGHLDIAGYPIIVQDTAGIRQVKEAIEQEGITRALSAADISDLKIIMIDAVNLNLPDDLRTIIDQNTIILINKIDQIEIRDLPLEIFNKAPIYISLKEKINLNAILNEIEKFAKNLASPLEVPSITRVRHRASVREALLALEKFSLKNDLVLAAEDVRMTMRSLSMITGKISVEEILGEIFSNFCIGK